jgi:glutathione synthase
LIATFVGINVSGIRAIARLGGLDVAAKIWDAIEAKRSGK